MSHWQHNCEPFLHFVFPAMSSDDLFLELLLVKCLVMTLRKVMNTTANCVSKRAVVVFISHKGKKSFSFFIFWGVCVVETGFFYVAPASLKLSVDQVGLKLTKNCLPLPLECWDQRHAPLLTA